MPEDARAQGSEAYLDAFMHGFEFVLFAIRGRLNDDKLDTRERARLEAFLDEYWRIVRAYRGREAAAPSPSALMARVFKIEVTPELAN